MKEQRIAVALIISVDQQTFLRDRARESDLSMSAYIRRLIAADQRNRAEYLRAKKQSAG